MNIFFTDSSPYNSARNLDTIRVNKMILESAQLLSTAINLSGGKATYKTTHANHPASIWCRQTRSNYMWLYRHFLGLMAQYKIRRGKTHACHKLIKELKEGVIYIPEGDLTKHPNCTRNKEKGIDYTHMDDVELAYHLYLSDRWDTDKREPTWR
jgi:hypothetical protein